MRYSIFFAGILLTAMTLKTQAYSGLYGQSVAGYAQAIGPAFNLQNSSPTAIVGNGAEFSVDFSDIFSTPWHLTVDLLDNYQVVFHTYSSNPSANISGGTVGWNLSGFGFSIADVQPLSLPPPG